MQSNSDHVPTPRGLIRALHVRGRRVLVAALALAMTVPLAGAPAPAAADRLDGPVAWSTFVAPGARPAVDEAQRLELAVRDAVAGGGFAATLTAAAPLGGSTPTVRLPTPTAEQMAAVATLPASQQAPVAGLYAAVHEAVRVLGGPTSAAQVRKAAQGLRHQLTADMTRRASGGSTSQSPSGDRTRFVSPFRSPRMPAAGRKASNSAGLLVMTALDTYLPLLGGATVSGAGGSGSGCDVVDELPDLCVASDADNVHADNAMLLIDFGGEDRYANTAGGAPFPLPEPPSYAPVSVNIDLAGDDAYTGGQDIENADEESLTTVTQGAAVGRAVGVLVDAAGNDTYDAAAADPLAASYTDLVAQGSGYLGVGALFDLAGSDRYSANASEGHGYSTVAAQGAGVGGCYLDWSAGSGSIICSVHMLGGVLVDRGVGADRYRVSSGTVAPTKSAGAFRILAGQGAALGGIGALVDDGGDDKFTARGSSVGPDKLSDPSAVPSIAVLAQGFGHAGIGMLLTGQGDSTYDAGSTGTDHTGWHIAWAQAFSGNGLAVLSDLGGDDQYALTQQIVADRDITLTDDCACSVRHRADYGLGSSSLDGQAATSAGTALLQDAAGDDSYTLHNVTDVSASLDDRRTTAPSRSRLDVVGYDLSGGGQGAGIAMAGTAYLVDAVGTDSYDFLAQATVLAEGVGVHPERPEVTALGGTPTSLAQGAGTTFSGPATGLIDLGGVGDRFVAEAVNTATTLPNPAGAFQDSFNGAFQAGTGTFVALGDRPEVLSRPSLPTCQMDPGLRRGFGHWMDSCEPVGAGYGGVGPVRRLTSVLGLAPDASGDDVSVLLTSPDSAPADYNSYDSPTPETETIPVSARVQTQDGRPVVGEPVHFFLAQRLPTVDGAPAGVGLGRLWQVEATTDAAGVASARLPLLATASIRQNGMKFFVEATFDGRIGAQPLMPEHVEAPLQIIG